MKHGGREGSVPRTCRESLLRHDRQRLHPRNRIKEVLKEVLKGGWTDDSWEGEGERLPYILVVPLDIGSLSVVADTVHTS